MLKMGIYTTTCTHDISLASARIGSSDTDRLLRTVYLRRATEKWKNLEGNPGNLVVCPLPITNQSGRWRVFVHGAPQVVGISGIAAVVLGEKRSRWSWDGNMTRQTAITKTGIRTPPAMWVNEYNVKPNPVQTLALKRSTEHGRWFSGRIVQVGDGKQDMELQSFLGEDGLGGKRECLVRHDVAWPRSSLHARIQHRECHASKAIQHRRVGRRYCTCSSKLCSQSLGLGGGTFCDL